MWNPEFIKNIPENLSVDRRSHEYESTSEKTLRICKLLVPLYSPCTYLYILNRLKLMVNVRHNRTIDMSHYFAINFNNKLNHKFFPQLTKKSTKILFQCMRCIWHPWLLKQRNIVQIQNLSYSFNKHDFIFHSRTSNKWCNYLRKKTLIIWRILVQIFQG